MHDREFGALATFGLAVPQANPTVEPEMWSLAPRDVSLLSTRLQGSRTNSRNRLVEYLDNFGDNLESFDTAPLDAVGYACTATSYLIGHAEETRRLGAFADRFGRPIISTAQAITRGLQQLGAHKIALLAPYPSWLVTASQAYWASCGFDIVSTTNVELGTDDTRAVYTVRTPVVVAAAGALDIEKADVILLTGTGMPTLRAIPEIARRSGKPVISSNLCLMWALLGAVGRQAEAPDIASGERLMGVWADRLDLK
jgi:maleate isomerase